MSTSDLENIKNGFPILISIGQERKVVHSVNDFLVGQSFIVLEINTKETNDNINYYENLGRLAHNGYHPEAQLCSKEKWFTTERRIRDYWIGAAKSVMNGA